MATPTATRASDPESPPVEAGATGWPDDGAGVRVWDEAGDGVASADECVGLTEADGSVLSEEVGVAAGAAAAAFSVAVAEPPLEP
jgi:hypothetical protein